MRNCNFKADLAKWMGPPESLHGLRDAMKVYLTHYSTSHKQFVRSLYPGLPKTFTRTMDWPDFKPVTIVLDTFGEDLFDSDSEHSTASGHSAKRPRGEKAPTE